MKKHLILYTLSFFLFTFALSVDMQAFAQQYGWTDISANIPGSPDLSDVFFVSDNEGWITSSSIAEIYHTTDGGETFEIQTTQFSTEALSMIDANVGYSGGTSGRVYRTSNGGGDWTPIGFISSTLTDMDFANSTQGYACGNSGAVFSITPEGVTNLSSGLSTNLYGISAPTVDNVWVCGGSTISYFSGTSFEYQSGPVGTYNSIFFINNNEGWVAGNSGLIGHTEDGGEIWHSQTNPDPDLHSLYGLFFLNENEGWTVGSQGTILKTTNGGDNWAVDEEGSVLTTNFLRGVHFTSPTNGYVVGNEKTLLKYGELTGTGSTVAETVQFEIYPNPAVDKFKIQSQKFKVGDANIEIYDLNGRKLIEKQIPAGTEEIKVDVSQMPGGVYFCRLIADEKSLTKKLIIK